MIFFIIFILNYLIIYIQLQLVVTLQPIGEGETFTIHLQTSENSENYNVTASIISKVQLLVHINYLYGKNHKEFIAKVCSIIFFYSIGFFFQYVVSF